MFKTFPEFWNGEIDYGGTKSKTIKLLIDYMDRFPRDNFLSTQFGDALVGVDKFYIKNQTLENQLLNKSLFSIHHEIAYISGRELPNGEKVKETSLIAGESHHNPVKRVELCLQNYADYYLRVVL